MAVSCPQRQHIARRPNHRSTSQVTDGDSAISVSPDKTAEVPVGGGGSWFVGSQPVRGTWQTTCQCLSRTNPEHWKCQTFFRKGTQHKRWLPFSIPLGAGARSPLTRVHWYFAIGLVNPLIATTLLLFLLTLLLKSTCLDFADLRREIDHASG